jgi:hypothetical protein
MNRAHGLALLGLLLAAPAAAQTSRVEGTVRTHAAAAPLAGAQVSVTRFESFFSGGTVVATGTTAADGGYSLSFEGACAFVCQIKVAAGPRIVQPSVRSVNQAAGATASAQDFTASLPASLRVTLREAVGGAVVSDLRPNALDERSSGAPSALLQADGSWLFDSLLPGTVKVCAISDIDEFRNECQGGQQLPLNSSLDGVQPLVLAESQAGIAEILLDRGGAVTGVIVDRYRNLPLGNTVVSVEVSSFSGSVSLATGDTTDPDGVYRIGGLPDGALRLIAKVGTPHYTPMRYPGIDCLDPSLCAGGTGSYIVINNAATVDNVGFDLFPGAVVRGRVLDAADNSPLAGVDVIAFKPQMIFGGHTEYARAVTGADGRYELTSIIPESPTRLGTENPLGYANRAWPEVPCLSNCSNGNDLEFAHGIGAGETSFLLPAARAIAGQMHYGNTDPGAVNAQLTVYVAAGDVLQRLWEGPVPASGAFVTPGLPAGTYYASVAFYVPEAQCQVYAGFGCPPAGQAIDVSAATPIVLPATPGIYAGTDFSFAIDYVFRNGME